MDNSKNPIPIQSPGKDDVVKKWHESRISMTEEYDTGAVVIQVDGIPIGTLGNFSASIGKAKSKKTFNVSAMTAAALSGEKVLTYEVSLPEDKKKILYVDTEQSKAHCKKTLARILALANLPDGTDTDRLEFLSLRKYTPKERIEIIECALATTEGIGLVIIDGVRDLLFDINAPLEATQITSILMRWTDEYQIHIHTILHQNKGDENARGHIGTEINNKAETVIQWKRTNPTRTSVRCPQCLHVHRLSPPLHFVSTTTFFLSLLRTMCPNRRKPVVRQRKSSTHTLTLQRSNMKPLLKGYFQPCLTNSIMTNSKTGLSKNSVSCLVASTGTRQLLKSLSSGTREWLYRITGNSTVTIGVVTAIEITSGLRLLYFILGAYI